VENILIIGSKGFIGGSCYSYFKKNNHYKVFQADILKDDESDNYYRLDSAKPDFKGLFKNQKFDFCINASGSASVPFSIDNPADDFRLNVANVNLILHAIRNENPDCRFVNFSSAAVYGNPLYLPVKENTQLAPVSPYGFHKMISEQICFEFWGLYNIRTCSLRVFSAFGTGLKKQLFWDLAQKADKNKIVKLFGTGNESRDFIYIDDLVSAIDIIISNSPFKGEAINISRGEEISVRHAAETFLNYYKPGATLRFSGITKQGDPLHWEADISKLKSLGFNPCISFEAGVKRYCDWLVTEQH
jgi:dTDP-glucose 4,6-dehydratase/UDP-glucose 4-epimerase